MKGIVPLASLVLAVAVLQIVLARPSSPAAPLPDAAPAVRSAAREAAPAPQAFDDGRQAPAGAVIARADAPAEPVPLTPAEFEQLQRDLRAASEAYKKHRATHPDEAAAADRIIAAALAGEPRQRQHQTASAAAFPRERPRLAPVRTAGRLVQSARPVRRLVGWLACRRGRRS